MADHRFERRLVGLLYSVAHVVGKCPKAPFECQESGVAYALLMKMLCDW